MTSASNDGSQDFKALSALAMASHEVRGALAAIISHAELLAERAGNPRESRATALLIEKHGRAVLETFDSILSSAQNHHRPVRSSSRPCDLRVMIEELVLLQTPRAVAAGLSLEASIDDAIPARLDLDADSLHRILSNLIENALKYTMDGGIRIRVLATTPGDLVLEVEDTGPGVEPSDVAWIFEPYVRSDLVRRSSISGVGLGLSLCRELARTMNAELTVDSATDGGSVFRLIFPGRLRQLDCADDVFEGARILLIDDCDDTLRLHSTILESRGALVTATSETRMFMPRFLPSCESFDLILVDLEMPDLDGWEVLELLNGHDCQVPVVAVTAHGIEPLRPRALERGFSGLLSKPLQIDTLAELIERCVHRKPGRLAG